MDREAQFRQFHPQHESGQQSPRRAYNLLRAAIREELLRPGEKLVEDELTSALATSRNAVREALRMLAEEGLVARSPKRGTVVARGVERIQLEEGFADGQQGSYAVKLIEERNVPTTALLRHRLDMDDAEVFMTEFLITYEKQISSLKTIYVRCGAAASMPYFANDFDRAESFRARFGTDLGSMQHTVEALPCDKRTSTALGLKMGEPILLQEILLVDDRGTPQELSYTYLRAGRAALVHTSSPRGGRSRSSQGGTY